MASIKIMIPPLKDQFNPVKLQDYGSSGNHNKMFEKSFRTEVAVGSAKRWPRGGTLGFSGWGCAAGTLEPLTYTRASSAEFCYPSVE